MVVTDQELDFSGMPITSEARHIHLPCYNFFPCRFPGQKFEVLNSPVDIAQVAQPFAALRFVS